MRKWITISYSWKYIVVWIAGQIVICGLIGTSLGWFWHHEWVRPCKIVPEYSSYEINRAELDFKSEWDRQDRIRLLKIEIKAYENGELIFPRDAVYGLKNELAKLTGKEKPVKIYQGKWHKSYLGIIK